MTTEQDKDTTQPPIFGMTDEELAATANRDFTADEADQPPPINPKPSQQQAMLQRLLDKEQALSHTATQPVVFSPPLISRDEVGVIGRGTVNIIQGAFGSHKSRLAELMAALMLTTNDTSDPQFLGFKRAMLERFLVCYIDTERNQKEELPYAIQGIKLRAGYRLDETPEHFRFTSIKGEERKDRFTLSKRLSVTFAIKRPCICSA